MATRRNERSKTQSRPGARPAPRAATSAPESARPSAPALSGSATASGIHMPASGSSIHAPIPGSGVHSTTGSGARDAVVERRATGNRGDGGSHAKSKNKSYGQRGMGLRAKFMLVLAGVTAAALIALGVTMALTTNSFLFGQKQHSGVEIARMAAQIGVAVNARLEFFRKLKADKNFSGIEIPTPTRAEIERDLVRYLESARYWTGQSNYT